MKSALDTRLGAWRARIETGLEESVRATGASAPQLFEAMGYSLMAGGKRLRPLLVLASAEAMGGASEDALPAALAVEMIHTYSLVHDDLPAMDDDDLRRGRPTNHKVHGEAMAILAGDALHTLAFETLAKAPLPAERVVRLVRTLSRASGARGMAGGQALDLEAEGSEAVTLELVETIHAHKTGALLSACFRLGAESAGAEDIEADELEAIGRSVGLAFQIQDDILDETATTTELGKTAGKDLRAGKATWPALLGLDAARARAAALLESALALLERRGEPAAALVELARLAVERRA